jgi:hypothetical protein
VQRPADRDRGCVLRRAWCLNAPGAGRAVPAELTNPISGEA